MEQITATPYPIRAVWRGVLQDIPKRKPSFFLSSLIAPLVFWVILGMLVNFQSEEILRAALPLVVLLLIGFTSTLALRAARRHHFRNTRLQRLAALVQALYYGTFLFSLSAYFLRVAIESGSRYSRLPSLVFTGLIGLYLVTIVASAAWGPLSLPRSREEDDRATARSIRWLPWVMGFQGSLISLGVFLGAWLMHGEVDWGVLLVVGISSLIAMLGSAISILGMYRFIILSLHPIPPELRQEFGLRS